MFNEKKYNTPSGTLKTNGEIVNAAQPDVVANDMAALNHQLRMAEQNVNDGDMVAYGKFDALHVELNIATLDDAAKLFFKTVNGQKYISPFFGVAYKIKSGVWFIAHTYPGKVGFLQHNGTTTTLYDNLETSGFHYCALKSEFNEYADYVDNIIASDVLDASKGDIETIREYDMVAYSGNEQAVASALENNDEIRIENVSELGLRRIRKQYRKGYRIIQKRHKGVTAKYHVTIKKL